MLGPWTLVDESMQARHIKSLINLKINVDEYMGDDQGERKAAKMRLLMICGHDVMDDPSDLNCCPKKNGMNETSNWLMNLGLVRGGKKGIGEISGEDPY